MAGVVVVAVDSTPRIVADAAAGANRIA